MIPITADQALRAMVWLGSQPVPRTRDEIAAGCGVPVGCLVRLLARLTRARLLAARRGRRGGYSLGRPAAAITLLEVVVAVDPTITGVIATGHAPGSGLDRTLAQARDREDRLLRRTSLATVIGCLREPARQGAGPRRRKRMGSGAIAIPPSPVADRSPSAPPHPRDQGERSHDSQADP